MNGQTQQGDGTGVAICQAHGIGSLTPVLLVPERSDQ
jgi:hypothetical protein